MVKGKKVCTVAESPSERVSSGRVHLKSPVPRIKSPHFHCMEKLLCFYKSQATEGNPKEGLSRKGTSGLQIFPYYIIELEERNN